MAYGEARTIIATDTFDAAISADWENGGGDWGTYSWVAGGHVAPTADSIDSAISYRAVAPASDHYSKVTADALTGAAGVNAYFGAVVRMAEGADESCYSGYIIDGDGFGQWEIYAISSVFGFTSIAVQADADCTLVAGEHITLEAEGTTLRLGSNNGGADVQKLTATDNTLASGSWGIAGFTETGGTTRVTAWEGGNIGVVSENTGDGTPGEFDPDKPVEGWF